MWKAYKIERSSFFGGPYDYVFLNHEENKCAGSWYSSCIDQLKIIPRQKNLNDILLHKVVLYATPREWDYKGPLSSFTTLSKMRQVDLCSLCDIIEVIMAKGIGTKGIETKEIEINILLTHESYHMREFCKEILKENVESI